MKKYIYIIGIAWLSSIGSIDGYATDKGAGKYAARLADVWDNWYAQVGLDMSLQNPYGYDFSKVFPNGKTFGVNAAVGRWFTPGLGLRAKANWENGIRWFENGHAAWLAPMYECGVNMDRGGYVALYGDIQFDIHNLFLGYDETRKWEAWIFPRAGLVSNRATKSGSPMVGAGFGATYRLNNRWSLYSDMAFQMTTSEFTGGVGPTGMSVSTGFNGFVDFHVGIQWLVN